MVNPRNVEKADTILTLDVAVCQPLRVGQIKTGSSHDRQPRGRSARPQLPLAGLCPSAYPSCMTDQTDLARRQLAQQANAEGMAALRSGDGASAAIAFRRAVEADPEAGALWGNLAHALRIAGDDAAERDALERALEIDRTNFVAQLRKAQNLERCGMEQAALVAWAGVLQMATEIENPSPELAAELAAGRGFVAGMQARLGVCADAAYATLEPELDETERRRIRAYYDLSLGRRQVFFNECAGLYYPFLPADEYFDRKHFPWLEELEAATEDIRAELHGLLAEGNTGIIPYVRLDEGTPQNKWSELSHSYDWSACFLYEYGRPNLPVLERCPRTAALLQRLPLAQIPGKAPNAFFSMLKPGSVIPPHTGVTNTRAIIHLALDVPPDCGFRVGGETREWVEGKAFAFDDSIDHEAWNRSDQRRHILIIDTWNPHLSPKEQQAIVRYFEAGEQLPPES